MNSGLAQYPDPKLYKAASLLKPEERVGSAGMLDPKHPILRIRPKTEMTVDFRNNKVLVNPNAEPYKNNDSKLLAALMAHEGVHLNHGTFTNDEHPDEGPAYQKQRDVLERLNYPNQKYMQELGRRITREEAKTRKASNGTQ